MRTYAIVGIACLAGAVGLNSDPGKGGLTERVDRLIKQLGHGEFAKREAASRELDEIGEPALAALRKAAAAGDADVRRRAERIVRAVTARVQAAAAKRELAKLQGEWSLVSYEVDGKKIKGEDGTHVFAFKGTKWSTHLGGETVQAGTIQRVEAKGKLNAIDLLITEGDNVGATALSIFAVEGDLLKYLNSPAPRAAEFATRPGDGRHYQVFRRARPGAARPPEVVFESAVFTTDLPLPESKGSVHRVTLKCRPADAEPGTLTLDPNPPRLDEFGDPAPGVHPNLTRAVTLDVTLKLVKTEKGRRLYELSGPKLTSRLSLVVSTNLTPWGNARLLVHSKGGDVRYTVDLSKPQPQLFPPCHPGCFPAGTKVSVPTGTKEIERVREGDVVTAIDAKGKASSSKVEGVFKTRNRLVEVRAGGATLLTTETQPVALEGGGFRPAGELKAGDRVWRWVGGKRQATAVTKVSPTGKEAEVFNLILGELTGFVAGGFVVRSKPPAPVRP